MQAQELLKKIQLKQADTVIRGGTLVTPSGLLQADVALIQGKIAALNSNGWRADKIIDATGLHVLPGVIDTQVHFREPGLTHKDDILHDSKGSTVTVRPVKSRYNLSPDAL